jgi:hypothetical protein
MKSFIQELGSEKKINISIGNYLIDFMNFFANSYLYLMKHFFNSLKEFSAALLMVESLKFNYLQRLIKATKLFIRAKKKVILERQKNLKQKKEIENAKFSNF